MNAPDPGPWLLRGVKITPDGDLDWMGGGEYVSFYAGSHNATLDGDFSARDLRLIADHMDAHQKPKATEP